VSGITDAADDDEADHDEEVDVNTTNVAPISYDGSFVQIGENQVPQAPLPGQYSVWYQGSQRAGGTNTITCDNKAGGYGYSNQAIHFDNVKSKCTQSRDALATMYILNTHGAGKYECLWQDGTTIKGSHYLGPNSYYGTVEYRRKTTTSCTASPYGETRFGAAVCDPGYEVITNEATCKLAQVSLKNKIWNSASSWGNIQKGCFSHSNKNVWFNTHGTGATHNAFSRVCTKAPFAVAGASQSCGQLGNADLTQQTCRAACTRIGMTGSYHDASWGHIGPKCFVTRNSAGIYGNCHWNSATNGVYSDTYRAVCAQVITSSTTMAVSFLGRIKLYWKKKGIYPSIYGQVALTAAFSTGSAVKPSFELAGELTVGLEWSLGLLSAEVFGKIAVKGKWEYNRASSLLEGGSTTENTKYADLCANAVTGTAVAIGKAAADAIFEVFFEAARKVEKMAKWVIKKAEQAAKAVERGIKQTARWAADKAAKAARWAASLIRRRRHGRSRRRLFGSSANFVQQGDVYGLHRYNKSDRESSEEEKNLLKIWDADLENLLTEEYPNEAKLKDRLGRTPVHRQHAIMMTMHLRRFFTHYQHIIGMMTRTTKGDQAMHADIKEWMIKSNASESEIRLLEEDLEDAVTFHLKRVAMSLVLAEGLVPHYGSHKSSSMNAFTIKMRAKLRELQETVVSENGTLGVTIPKATLLSEMKKCNDDEFHSEAGCTHVHTSIYRGSWEMYAHSRINAAFSFCNLLFIPEDEGKTMGAHILETSENTVERWDWLVDYFHNQGSLIRPASEKIFGNAFVLISLDSGFMGKERKKAKEAKSASMLQANQTGFGKTQILSVTVTGTVGAALKFSSSSSPLVAFNAEAVAQWVFTPNGKFNWPEVYFQATLTFCPGVPQKAGLCSLMGRFSDFSVGVKIGLTNSAKKSNSISLSISYNPTSMTTADTRKLLKHGGKMANNSAMTTTSDVWGALDALWQYVIKPRFHGAMSFPAIRERLAVAIRDKLNIARETPSTIFDFSEGHLFVFKADFNWQTKTVGISVAYSYYYALKIYPFGKLVGDYLELHTAVGVTGTISVPTRR